MTTESQEQALKSLTELETIFIKANKLEPAIDAATLKLKFVMTLSHLRFLIKPSLDHNLDHVDP